MAFDIGKYVNLPMAVKLLGIVLLGWGVFNAWTVSSVLTRFLIVSGPIAWYVGDKFYKFYSPTK